MQINWGNKLDWTFYLWHDLSNWALPFNLDWRYTNDVKNNKCFMISLRFYVLELN